MKRDNSTRNTQHATLIILAGGKSSRMGRDKALLPFGNHPTLTQYQLTRLSPSFQKIYVGCKTRDKFGFEADFIEDLPEYHESAPHIGLISAFAQLRHEERLCVLSVDTPFFGAQHFEKLLRYDTAAYDAVVARSPKGNQPLCALYKRSALPALKRLAAEGRYRFRDLFKEIETLFIPFDDEAIFTNLNRPGEYEEASSRLL